MPLRPCRNLFCPVLASYTLATCWGKGTTMPKLTKTYIDKIAPPAEGYELHWDDAVRGYGR